MKQLSGEESIMRHPSIIHWTLFHLWTWTMIHPSGILTFFDIFVIVVM